MREIEMKILEIPRQRAFAALRRIGAKRKYRVFMRVQYLDFPDRRIMRKKDLLRLRECRFDNGKHGTEVVYKVYRGIRRGCKIFDEFEWWLEGKHAFSYLSDFFRQLGLIQTLYYEKRRTLFEVRYRGRKRDMVLARLEFDEHPKIPPLLEIEASSEVIVHEILMKLGLQNYEFSPETIEEVMRRKYPKISLNGLRFSL